MKKQTKKRPYRRAVVTKKSQQIEPGTLVTHACGPAKLLRYDGARCAVIEFLDEPGAESCVHRDSIQKTYWLKDALEEAKKALMQQPKWSRGKSSMVLY